MLPAVDGTCLAKPEGMRKLLPFVFLLSACGGEPYDGPTSISHGDTYRVTYLHEVEGYTCTPEGGGAPIPSYKAKMEADKIYPGGFHRVLLYGDKCSTAEPRQ